MKILVYGAGVIGSVYASRLQEAGQNVTLLARGQRAVALRSNGIQLEDAVTGAKTTTRVSVVEQLAPGDKYNVVIVTLRLDQLEAVLPVLAANKQVPTYVFLIANPVGKEQFAKIGVERVVAGFPSAGGSRKGDTVHYLAMRQVATMLGELDGRVTPRLHELTAMFKQAGFSAKISTDMQAWLKAHVIMDICIIPSALNAGGSGPLAHSRPAVTLLVNSVRDGLLSLKALGTPIMPFYLTFLFLWLPRWLSITLFQQVLKTRISALGIDSHLDDDIGEIRQMARDIMAQLHNSTRATPNLDRMMKILEQLGTTGVERRGQKNSTLS